MSNWLAHLLSSFANQAGTWFVGAVLAALGLFSSHILENIKLALNRANLRVKYYEEMATEISSVVHIIDRLDRVYYRADWASDDDKGAIATEYDEVMNSISRKEYVYLSWLHRYWGKDQVTAFAKCMEKIRAVDLVLIRLNAVIDGVAKGPSVSRHDAGDRKDKLLAALRSGLLDLQKAAHSLLVGSI
ncbi:MAG: hypothetical protein ACLQKA_20315 [Bryobacteraceae bacterium]